jgi:predicted signal transduction protein with EAL and GGDEF domain
VAAAQEPFQAYGHELTVTPSVGIAVYPRDGADLDALARAADVAMYRAKEDGRNTWRFFTAELQAHSDRALLVSNALRRALERDQFSLAFQPQMDLDSGHIVGAEALLRWQHPDLGWVSPAEFIPIAEERGFIGQLSQVLLRKAARAAVDWPEEVSLSFNLSPSQLVDQNTSEQVLAILRETGLPPSRLQIEITETGMMCEPASAEKIVEDLRAAGIRIALDDFGTGQSSLGRLRQLHFDTIKIDQAFVASMLADAPTQHILRAILDMCRGLQKDVVAEGIECEDQAARLAAFGCQKGQGYLFGRPMRADATAAHVHGYSASARTAFA